MEVWATILGPTSEAGMGDFLYIVIFLVCCAATAGLTVLCDRLAPKETGSKP